ncbi:MAG: hypothetical protein Ct9H300mP23_02750 [Nitrospinota bacterium]|nr:MAG: hypothetical protein Ct9H300mP23_02750 [Nitrospinota bacterium]
MFKRSLTTEGENDVQIPVKQFIPVVSCNGQVEIKSMMSIWHSNWYYTILKPAFLILFTNAPNHCSNFHLLPGLVGMDDKANTKMYDIGKVP